MSSPVLECRQLCKEFVLGSERIQVLKDIDFTLRPSERIAIMGSSGAGKTTLLSILGGLEKPTAGQVMMGGEDITKLNANQLAGQRMRTVGFVYQFHHLLMEFTAQENVAIPVILAGGSPKDAMQAARQLLTQVELKHRIMHKPAELSGGERQRVAVARALVTQPACVLMDEPTGNLDENTSHHIHQLIRMLSDRLNTALLIVTHNQKLAAGMDRIYLLERGTIRLQPS